MATTDDDDVNVGEGSGDAKQDSLEIASALQNELCDLTTAGTGDGASALTEVLDFAAECIAMKAALGLSDASLGSEGVERQCTHSRSEPANGDLFQRLPLDVQMEIFKKLPLLATWQLRLVNKEWSQILSSADFHQMRSKVYPRMVCLITRIKFNMFWVRVLDHLRQEWHTYQIRVTSPMEWGDYRRPPHMFAACEDQGLICFVTECYPYPARKEDPPTYYFAVVNPLTRSNKELPPVPNCRAMRLVRIHVDKTTKAFKVIVLARRSNWTEPGDWTFDGVVEHEYNSRSDEWITTDGRDGDPDSARRDPFDFETELFMQDWGAEVPRPFSILSKGRLFVLHCSTAASAETANLSLMFYIDEFHWQIVEWVKVDSHRCDPFERRPKFFNLKARLHACDGFLMVIMYSDSCRDNERFRLVWLYDLSTKKWSILDQFPLLPVGPRTYDPHDFMIQNLCPPGGWGFSEVCDNTYNISMMLEPKWVT